MLYLSDKQTIVKMHTGLSKDAFKSEIVLVCLCGDAGSTGMFAQLAFDLYNCIDMYETV